MNCATDWNKAAVGKLVWWLATMPDHLWVRWVNTVYIKAWIYFDNALKTNFKLHKLGIDDDDIYTICGMGSETDSHLFFECEYSSKIIALIGNQIRENIPVDNHTEWRRRLTGSTMRKGIINALLNASIYAIWRQRNLCKDDLVLLTPEKVAMMIIKEVTNRILSFQEQMGSRERELIEGLHEHNG
ncbi:uncharacterized protein LOC141602269 [Silene latifolia]|uniref:uncharacterized protein LOC141602269 n=1 Tax=Silene latifolia TaxID=37657 RepID=UPI003D786AB4